MVYHLGFYIHHHGSGHIMRSISIANKFTDIDVTFLGSNLRPFKKIIPDQIKCIDLPLDVPSADEVVNENYNNCKNFLYAPINVATIRQRNKKLVDFFATQSNLIFIVDTSPEIVAFSRLCGVPAVIVQQHGFRNDLAHLLAYDNATKIIAPFASKISPDCPNWVKNKTIYSGGFSKFDGKSSNLKPTEMVIGVLVGTGGTSINNDFVKHLANAMPSYAIKVIGQIDTVQNSKDSLPSNLTFTGRLNNPLMELQDCSVVIGNAGHNTVMEMASLNKKFICIPEKRPFFEQLDKAAKIKNSYWIKTVLPEEMFTTNWNTVIEEALQQTLNWGDMINPNALKIIRKELDQLATELFI